MVLLLLGLLLVWVQPRLLLLLGKSRRGGASRRVMYYGPSGRTGRVMVRKMGIVLVLLLQLLSSLELLLLHVRRMVMRTGRLLLAVVTVHLHVMVKTGGGCGVGMVLFLEILLLLLVLVDVLRLRLVVAVFGRHLLHVTLGDLGSLLLLLLLLLLIRRRMLSVWRDNVIRLLVGAVVADQLQV